jgi:hypothetical protein
LINDLNPDLVHDTIIKIQLTKVLQDRVKIRFGNILTETNIALRAAALDPCYVHLDFVSKKVHDNTWAVIADEAVNLPHNTPIQPSSNSELSFVPDESIRKATIEIS